MGTVNDSQGRGMALRRRNGQWDRHKAVALTSRTLFPVAHSGEGLIVLQPEDLAFRR